MGHHFKVMITNWAIIESLPGDYRRKWSLLVPLPPITGQVMVFGDDYQSDDYFEFNEAGKWWKLQVQNSEEKMGDRHHPAIAVMITFKVMASLLPIRIKNLLQRDNAVRAK